MTEGNGIGMGGAAMALGAMALAEAEEANNISRRGKNRGRDQVLIESRYSFEETCQRIAKRLEVDFVDEKIVMKKGFSIFDFCVMSSITFCLSLLIGFMIMILSDIIFDYNTGEFVDGPSFFKLCAIFGIVVGIISALPCWEEIDGVGVSYNEGDRGALVVLERYDSSGYRVLDEDDIYRIEGALK